jgi:hypothetical protein
MLTLSWLMLLFNCGELSEQSSETDPWCFYQVFPVLYRPISMIIMRKFSYRFIWELLNTSPVFHMSVYTCFSSLKYTGYTQPGYIRSNRTQHRPCFLHIRFSYRFSSAWWLYRFIKFLQVYTGSNKIWTGSNTPGLNRFSWNMCVINSEIYTGYVSLYIKWMQISCLKDTTCNSQVYTGCLTKSW